MPNYMTKQRKALMNFFLKNKDVPVTAQQIFEKLKNDNISVSAVYRNLSSLEQEGKLQRINKAESREVYYRYSAFDSCKDCLHLSCRKCGKTFHLNDVSANDITKTLSSTENFQLDKSNTVMYGICKNCNTEEI